MTRMLYAVALLATLGLGAGCAMCEPPLEHQPSAYGGVCADGACGHRAGSIISGGCGASVEKVVMGKGDFPESLESLPSEPVPAMPREMQEEAPPEFEPESSLLPEGRAVSPLDAPQPGPGLFPSIDYGAVEVQSDRLEAPLPAEAGEAVILPLGPAADPPLPGE